MLVADGVPQTSGAGAGVQSTSPVPAQPGEWLPRVACQLAPLAQPICGPAVAAHRPFAHDVQQFPFGLGCARVVPAVVRFVRVLKQAVPRPNDWQGATVRARQHLTEAHPRSRSSRSSRRRSIATETEKRARTGVTGQSEPGPQGTWRQRSGARSTGSERAPSHRGIRYGPADQQLMATQPNLRQPSGQVGARERPWRRGIVPAAGQPFQR